MNKLKSFKLFVESEDITYDDAVKQLSTDEATKILSEVSEIIKYLDDKSKVISEFKQELSNHLSKDKDKNNQIDDTYVNLDLVNKNMSDLKTNLDTIHKSIKDYVDKGENFIY